MLINGKKVLATLSSVAVLLSCVALGGTATASTDRSSGWLVEQDYNAVPTSADLTDGKYPASNSDGADSIRGNGSGRTVSDAHSYDEETGAEDGGHSVLLNMNQTADGNVAQTVVVDSNGIDLKVTRGATYLVSFWAYSEEARTVTFHSHTIGSRSSPNNSTANGGWKCEETLSVSMAAGTWQHITLAVDNVSEGKDAAAERWLTIGATCSGAVSNPKGLYVDEVKVCRYVAGTSLQEFELQDMNSSLALSTANGNITLSNAVNHSAYGFQSLKVYSTTNAGGVRPQMQVTNGTGTAVTVEQGKSYEVSFYVYCPEGATTNKFRYWLCAVEDPATAFTATSQKNATVLYETGSDIALTAGTWQRVETTIESCAYSGYLRLGMASPLTSAATFYVDDIRVKAIATPQGFEGYEAGTSLALATVRGGSATVSTEAAYAGTQSLKINATNSGGFTGWNRPQVLLTDGQNTPVYVEQGKDYTVSFRLYIPADTPASDLRFWLCANEDTTASFTATAQKNACVLYELNEGTVETGTWLLFSIPVSSCDYSGYLRLGVTAESAKASAPVPIYLDAVCAEEFSVDPLYQDYEAVSALRGNGSGRELSTAQNHTMGGSTAVRLKMNQTGDNSYARTVIQMDGADYRAVPGMSYAVSFWAYWDPAENSAEDTRSETELALTCKVGSVSDPSSVFNEYVNGSEGSSAVTLSAGTWTKVTVLVNELDGVEVSTNAYLTLGAFFSGANASTNIKYLYVDDVTVMSLGLWQTEYAVDAIGMRDTAALVYTGGETGSQDPAMEADSAVYWSETDGVAYAAMRVFGEYTCVDGDLTKLDYNGVSWAVKERGILQGDGTATVPMTLGNTESYIAKMSEIGSALYDCWNYDEETGTVHYAMLVKDIPVANKDTSYAFRAYMVLNVGDGNITVYSPQQTLTVQSLYDVAVAENAALKWYGDITGPAATDGTAVSLLDGFDSRFTVVYPDGDAEAQTAAAQLQAGMAEAMLETDEVACTADTAADAGGYEILVGATNRTADDAAIADMAALSAAYNAAYTVRMNGNKIVIAAADNRATDAENGADDYAYALKLAVEQFLSACCNGTTMAVPATLSMASQQQSLQLGGTDVGGYTIVVEKYPSYMVLTAAQELQKQIAVQTGKRLPVVKYAGVDYINEIRIGPKNGSVTATYGEDGYLNGVNSSGLLDVAEEQYQISQSGTVLSVNGGSTYAVNAGVQALLGTLGTQTAISDGYAVTGSYADAAYSLSDGYALTFGDDFNYAYSEEGEAQVRENWYISRDTTNGPTNLGTDEEGNTLWDVQSRPGIYGKDGTFYTEDGYLYQITKKSDDGYYAGRLTTQGKMNYRYGFTEVRMIMGTNNGACSAVWMSADGISGQAAHAEIDVYENYGQDRYFACLHTWAPDSLGGHVNHISSGDMPRQWVEPAEDEHFYDTFHYIGFEWTDTTIDFYLDGELTLSVDISDEKFFAFRQEIMLKLANGVGTGYYANGHNPADYLDDVSLFKETQVVDYVYIFQKNDPDAYMWQANG